MPIYMDRHDVSDTVTAENVAQLHREDLKIQDQFGCKGLTYWFDEKRKHAFCLIEAPDANAIQNMHKHAHGEVPTRIIEVDANIVESFLGRIQDPEKAKNSALNIIRDAAFRIIMVILLKKTKPFQHTSEKLKSSFKKLQSEIINALNLYDGNSVTQSDYYYLVSFTSVSNAVQAALKIQSLFKSFNKKAQDIILKIGLNAGVPVTYKQSIFEEAIKLTERMCEVVKSEMIISPEVKNLYESENADGFSNAKNICFLTKADEKFITLLMDYTDSCWNNINLKVDNFSKPVQCSKSQLYRKIILLTGQSPNSFIKEYRLKEALKLLNKNSGNISEIAFETGFSSPSYFSKCFQKKYGCMPSDFLA